MCPYFLKKIYYNFVEPYVAETIKSSIIRWMVGLFQDKLS